MVFNVPVPSYSGPCIKFSPWARAQPGDLLLRNWVQQQEWMLLLRLGYWKDWLLPSLPSPSLSLAHLDEASSPMQRLTWGRPQASSPMEPNPTNNLKSECGKGCSPSQTLTWRDCSLVRDPEPEDPAKPCPIPGTEAVRYYSLLFWATKLWGNLLGSRG